MKATEANLLEFLSIRKQLVIPIYQRTYSWTKSQCKQLWQDIERVAKDDSVPAHFIGSIVYIQEGIYHATSAQQMLVIDGQQRLTTVSLLLLALANVIGDSDKHEINRTAILEYYLFNRLMKGEQAYKMMLTQSDKETFIALLDNLELPSSPSPRLVANYDFFVDRIQKSTLSIDEIYSGISKLLIVDVSLDRQNDNPQLIFESLNSTGLDLTQADLIRNYILMGMVPEEQEEIYRRYWYPMEQSFGHAQYAKLFDRFMRDYLTIKSDIGDIPNIGAVYSEFKKYIQDKDVFDVIDDVYQFSRYFVRLAFPERNEDHEIRGFMSNINTLKVDVAYPLLLESFDDFERHQLITRDEFIEILELVESYVIRRVIVGIPTNSMNKTFATFKRDIKKDDYLNSIKYAFSKLSSYRRFPSDNEFAEAFIIKDIYNLRQRRNYLLSRLENYDRKEWVNIEEYTIEHIMPQNPNLSSEWQQELGENWQEVQERYLHTIGNLTLTGYNPELSDRPFLNKRDMDGGFADSPLRLNRTLAKVDQWTVEEIVSRAIHLAKIAQDIWRYPHLPADVIEWYKEAERDQDGYTSLDHFSNQLQGDVLEIFDALRKRILNLDSSVRQEPKQKYIAYKTTKNFVDIVPQKSRLQLYLNMDIDEVNDPQNICKDKKGIGKFSSGDVEFIVESLNEIDYAMFLIQQSFEKHSDEITA